MVKGEELSDLAVRTFLGVAAVIIAENAASKKSVYESATDLIGLGYTLLLADGCCPADAFDIVKSAVVTYGEAYDAKVAAEPMPMIPEREPPEQWE